ncbi:uncharacterized protein LOC133038911 [Cannabis sativa]|uniref:uncharacterized protein LOC133038911 n=1 Tax=Cannabis sativa TaxID=3483 RepID=UPI0029C9FCF6|nr:uncharacterized protein LOC133038911 [Cannabis sativa]
MEIPNNQNGLKIEYHHGVCLARNPKTGVIEHHLPIPQAENVFGNFFYYDPRTRETKFVINSEKGYEIIKLGDQNWRPLQPDFRKGQRVLMFKDKDREKLLFFYAVRTPQQQGTSDLEISCFDLSTEEYENLRNFPRNIFCDVTKLIPFYWKSDPAIGELSKEDGLRVLIMKNDYSWNEQVIEISSAFLNLHLITMKFLPIHFVKGVLRFQCNDNQDYYFFYNIRTGSVTGYSKEFVI